MTTLPFYLGSPPSVLGPELPPPLSFPNPKIERMMEGEIWKEISDFLITERLGS